MNEEVLLQLVNVLGQVVEVFSFGSMAVFEQKADLRCLASGVYYFVVGVDRERVMEKNVVE